MEFQTLRVRFRTIHRLSPYAIEKLQESRNEGLSEKRLLVLAKDGACDRKPPPLAFCVEKRRALPQATTHALDTWQSTSFFLWLPTHSYLSVDGTEECLLIRNSCLSLSYSLARERMFTKNGSTSGSTSRLGSLPSVVFRWPRCLAGE